MALRNQESISEFGRRLYSLIDEYDSAAENKDNMIKSPKGLAKRLYDQGLIHVNTRENYDYESRDYNNAVGSIEKSIVNHIKTGVIKDQKGEFVIAYSRFFKCSADYILCLTDIRTPDVETRRICEITGLSESAVARLIESRKNRQLQQTGCWSMLMGSELYYTVPEDWLTLAEEEKLSMQKEVELNVLRWEETQAMGPDKMDIRLDMEGAKQEMDSHRAAFYGMLSKISRNVADFIEQETVLRYAEFKLRFMDEMMKDARMKYNKQQ